MLGPGPHFVLPESELEHYVVRWEGDDGLPGYSAVAVQRGLHVLSGWYGGCAVVAGPLLSHGEAVALKNAMYDLRDVMLT